MNPNYTLSGKKKSKDDVIDTVYQRAILAGLNNLRKHIYAGTVPAAVVAKRRAKNRVARKQAVKNRG